MPLSWTEPGTTFLSSSTPFEADSLMIRWRYESVIVNPSPIEIVATMTAFSPPRADAFWTLMTKDDPASAHTAHVSPARAKTRRVTRRPTPFDRAPRPERAGCLRGTRLARGQGPVATLIGKPRRPRPRRPEIGRAHV